MLVILDEQDIVDNAGRLLPVRLVIIQHPGDTELVGGMGDDRSPTTVSGCKYLVTAGYHMPRSLRLFHSLMPEVTLVPYPVEPPNVDLSKWWQPHTLHLLHNEFLKYMASIAMTLVGH